jgi:hypothetical protein
VVGVVQGGRDEEPTHTSIHTGRKAHVRMLPRPNGTAMNASSAVPVRGTPRRTIENASHDALRIISSGWKRSAEVTSRSSSP